MNDHSDHRRRGEPEWPAADAPDQGSPGGGADRTGQWSPLWEDDDSPGDRPRATPRGQGRQGPPPGDRPRVTGQDRRGQTPPADPRAQGAPRRPGGPPATPPGGPQSGPNQPRRPAGPPPGDRPRATGDPNSTPPGDRTRVTGERPGGPASNPPGDRTRVTGDRPGGPASNPPGDRTRVTGGPSSNPPGDRTRVTGDRPGGPASNPPGDRTRVTGNPPGDRTRVTGGPTTNLPGTQGGRTTHLPSGRSGGPHSGPNGAPPPGGPAGRRPGGRPPAGPGRPDNSEDPTVFLPNATTGVRSEPALLTHREPADEEEQYYDDPHADDADQGVEPTDEQARKARRKKVWRRVRRTAYVLTALAIIVPIVAFFITYQMVDVPNPDEIAAQQNKAVTVYYADGTTEMTKIAESGGNRIMLKPGDIPDNVQKAVFAAEDASFATNSGFDITGILRAVWFQVTSGSGGGSGITQQYIKKATGNEEPTLSRKWVEMVKAYKMSQNYEKPDILAAYLNTIYFGRGAYGIKAAAKAFYNVDDLTTLSKSQAALLAGMIQTPGKANKPDYQMRRWEYVTGQMIQNGWMTEAEKAAQPFPAPVPLEETKSGALPGPRQRIPQVAIEELESRGVITEDQLKRNGYSVVTTIDPQAQQIAENAVGKIMDGQPINLHAALVAVDPATGQIKAYYGGPNNKGLDWAATIQEPGSSFKPFDLVGLLKKGRGLGETYESRNREIGGKEIRNASTPSCSVCTVAQAMKESLNVVFSEMVYKDVKPAQVAKAAAEAGVRTPLDKATGDINIAIGGGATQVTTVDMASSYATFAANGIYRPAHIVSKVMAPDGTVVWDEATDSELQEKSAFDPDPAVSQKISRNVTESLLPIPASSKIPCADGRECAGKTGTHQYGETKNNSKAWMVGYTVQMSAAVSLSGDQENGLEIFDSKRAIVYGSGLPGKIWQQFMNDYHKALNLEKKGFGKFVPIGRATAPSSKPPTTTAPKPTETPETTTQPEVTSPPPASETEPSENSHTKPPKDTTTSPLLPGFPGGPGNGNGPGNGTGPGRGYDTGGPYP